MNWKEFFKPTKGKIITTIIFIILGVIIFLSGFGCGWGGSPIYCKIILPILVYIFSFGFLQGRNFTYYVINAGRSESGFIYLATIFQIIWSYFLACLIVLMINKIKSKKKK